MKRYDYAKHSEKELTQLGWKQIPKELGYQVLSRARRGKQFTFNGKVYGYCLDRYNATFFCERAVEIPIFKELLTRFSHEEALEVGNVLSHYGQVKHQIIDKYEKGDGVITLDVGQYNPRKKYRVIVSISTLEHVGWDERPLDRQKIYQTITHLQGLLEPGGELWVSWPMGYHPVADVISREIKPFTKMFYLKRKSWINDWKQTKYAEVAGLVYGKPYLGGNGLVIAKW